MSKNIIISSNTDVQLPKCKQIYKGGTLNTKYAVQLLLTTATLEWIRNYFNAWKLKSNDQKVPIDVDGLILLSVTFVQVNLLSSLLCCEEKPSTRPIWRGQHNHINQNKTESCGAKLSNISALQTSISVKYLKLHSGELKSCWATYKTMIGK